MKKTKFFLITFLSLVLPSCSDSNNSSQKDSLLTEDTERLNEFQINDDFYSQSSPTPLKFPASSGKSSGEMSSIVMPQNETENQSLSFESSEEADLSNTSNSSRELLASYSSKVYTKTEDRQKNLRIVCEKLSGTTLAPNQEFSYNTTCGPYNKENGFGKATVFLGDGTEKEDYGGGVCQLSSTLYNAVKDLNVEITERHNHSKKVYYVPDGEDATVSYGNLDFKFKNLNDFSLYFEATSNAEHVNVYVYKA